MAAEFIGIDAICDNLNKSQFCAIGVYDKKLEKFKKIASEDETEADLIDAFVEWSERMLASNPINFKTYSIQLYDMPEGGKKLRGTISFTFSLCATPTSPIKAENSFDKSGYISKAELNLALENQRLAFENTLLKKQIEEEENEEDFEEDFEEEPKSLGSVMQEQLMGKLPQLIDLAIAAFAPNQNTNNLKTMAGNTDEIIAEFKTINPDIESDLAKLLDLAKNNPQLFKMLINQLRAM